MRSLQYCCLMIPVKNRELLQVLLKFMVRLLDNHALSLSDDLPTKEKVFKIGGNVLSFKFLSQISLYMYNMYYIDLAKAKSEALKGSFRKCLPQLIILWP